MRIARAARVTIVLLCMVAPALWAGTFDDYAAIYTRARERIVREDQEQTDRILADYRVALMALRQGHLDVDDHELAALVEEEEQRLRREQSIPASLSARLPGVIGEAKDAKRKRLAVAAERDRKLRELAERYLTALREHARSISSQGPPAETALRDEIVRIRFEIDLLASSQARRERENEVEDVSGEPVDALSDAAFDAPAFTPPETHAARGDAVDAPGVEREEERPAIAADATNARPAPLNQRRIWGGVPTLDELRGMRSHYTDKGRVQGGYHARHEFSSTGRTVYGKPQYRIACRISGYRRRGKLVIVHEDGTVILKKSGSEKTLDGLMGTVPAPGTYIAALYNELHSTLVGEAKCVTFRADGSSEVVPFGPR